MFQYFSLIKKYQKRLSFSARILKRELLEKQDSFKQQLENLNNLEHKLINLIGEKSRPANQWFWFLVMEEIFLSDRPKIIKELKSVAFRISYLKKTSSLIDNHITEEEIKQAKEVPMTLFYEGEVRRQANQIAAKCPFHNDHAPSFFIYLKTNSWYCYAETIGGDTIDYVMRLHKLNFREAVKYLMDL